LKLPGLATIFAGRAASTPPTETAMGFISLVWGVLATLFMLIALIPLLGWLNWLVIPFAAIGVILAAIGIMLRGEKGRRAKAGLVLNLAILVIAAIRLSMGGGIL
jgi:hypothetical protein